jgi:hypothetical protein
MILQRDAAQGRAFTATSDIGHTVAGCDILRGRPGHPTPPKPYFAQGTDLEKQY